MNKAGVFLILAFSAVFPVRGDIVPLPSCTEERPEVYPVVLNPEGEAKAEAMAWFARFTAESGQDKEKAVNAIARAIEKDPDSRELAVFMAAAMVRSGTKYSSFFAGVAGRHCSSPFLISITAGTLSAMGQRNEVEKLLTRFAEYAEKNTFAGKDQKDAADSIGALVMMLFESGKNEEAERLLNTFMERPEYRENPMLLQQEYLFCRKKLSSLPEEAKHRTFPWILPPESERWEERLRNAEILFSAAIRNTPRLPGFTQFRKLIPILLEKKKKEDVLILMGSGLLKQTVTLKDFDDLALFYQFSRDPVNEARVRKAALAKVKKANLHRWAMYASALRRSGDFRQAAEIFRKCIKGGMNGQGIPMEAALAESAAGNWEQALGLLEKLPRNPNRLRLETVILLNAREYGKAADTAMQILKMPLPASMESAGKENRSRVLFAAAAAEKAGRIKAVKYLLETLLEKFPEDPELLNFLGFTLADHDMELDRAERLIKKALDRDPANEAILDSMAWVLYRKKQYAEAEKWMQKCLKSHKGKKIDAEILDHAGDILHALRLEKQALDCWERALHADNAVNRDKSLIRSKFINLWKKTR